MTERSSFRYFKTSPEVIRLTVMLYIRFPLSLQNMEDLLHERGIEVSRETVRFWWQRFGPMFAAREPPEARGSDAMLPLALAPPVRRPSCVAKPDPMHRPVELERALG